MWLSFRKWVTNSSHDYFMSTQPLIILVGKSDIKQLIHSPPSPAPLSPTTPSPPYGPSTSPSPKGSPASPSTSPPCSSPCWSRNWQHNKKTNNIKINKRKTWFSSQWLAADLIRSLDPIVRTPSSTRRWSGMAGICRTSTSWSTNLGFKFPKPFSLRNLDISFETA